MINPIFKTDTLRVLNEVNVKSVIITIFQWKYLFLSQRFKSIGFFIYSRDVQYSKNAKEILAFIVDCTADDEFFEYSKEIMTTILEHYHEQADVRNGILDS